MKKGFLFLLAVSLFLGMAMLNLSATSIQAEEDVAQNIEETTGEIVSTSTQGLSIVVKYLVDKELQDYRTATFYFSDTIEIKKNDETVKFVDLKVGDKLTLRYTEEEGWKKVVVSASLM